MTDAASPRRFFRAAPAWLIFGLLVVECLLWLSERFQWFWFNERKGWTVLIALAVVGVAMLVMLGRLAACLLFRWRFQFSIRSMLVLVAVVALPCSWMAVEKKLANRQREAVEAIRKFGGVLQYDYEVGAFSGRLPSQRPPWLGRLLGDDFFSDVYVVDMSVTNVTEAVLENLKCLNELKQMALSGAKVTDSVLENLIKRLNQLQGLGLYDTQVTNDGLRNLKGLKYLNDLDLTQSEITDAGLEHLKKFPQLQRLSLHGTKVTDAGLENLKGLHKLQMLGLDDTQITDAGLQNLSGLNELEELSLFHTQVTDVGVKKLTQALPKCWIVH